MTAPELYTLDKIRPFLQRSSWQISCCDRNCAISITCVDDACLVRTGLLLMVFIPAVSGSPLNAFV